MNNLYEMRITECKEQIHQARLNNEDETNIRKLKDIETRLEE